MARNTRKNSKKDAVKIQEISLGRQDVLFSSFSSECVREYALEPNLSFLKFLHDAPQLGVDSMDGYVKNVAVDPVSGEQGEPFEDKNMVLEGYFNDLYKLLIRKLAEFDCADSVTDQDKIRLKKLLEEMIRIKTMLAGLVVKENNRTVV